MATKNGYYSDGYYRNNIRAAIPVITQGSTLAKSVDDSVVRVYNTSDGSIKITLQNGVYDMNGFYTGIAGLENVSDTFRSGSVSATLYYKDGVAGTGSFAADGINNKYYKNGILFTGVESGVDGMTNFVRGVPTQTVVAAKNGAPAACYGPDGVKLNENYAMVHNNRVYSPSGNSTTQLIPGVFFVATANGVDNVTVYLNGSPLNGVVRTDGQGKVLASAIYSPAIDEIKTSIDLFEKLQLVDVVANTNYQFSGGKLATGLVGGKLFSYGLLDTSDNDGSPALRSFYFYKGAVANGNNLGPVGAANYNYSNGRMLS